MQENAGVQKKLLNLSRDDHCVSHFYTRCMHDCEENKDVLTL